MLRLVCRVRSSVVAGPSRGGAPARRQHGRRRLRLRRVRRYQREPLPCRPARRRVRVVPAAEVSARTRTRTRGGARAPAQPLSPAARPAQDPSPAARQRPRPCRVRDGARDARLLAPCPARGPRGLLHRPRCRPRPQPARPQRPPTSQRRGARGPRGHRRSLRALWHQVAHDHPQHPAAVVGRPRGHAAAGRWVWAVRVGGGACLPRSLRVAARLCGAASGDAAPDLSARVPVQTSWWPSMATIPAPGTWHG